MYDNEYDLDMILTEARKLKGQKRPEQQPGAEADASLPQTDMPAERRSQSGVRPPEFTEPLPRGYTQERAAPPPHGFRMSRESAVFGEYRAEQTPDPAKAQTQEPSAPRRRDEINEQYDELRSRYRAEQADHTQRQAAPYEQERYDYTPPREDENPPRQQQARYERQRYNGPEYVPPRYERPQAVNVRREPVEPDTERFERAQTQPPRSEQTPFAPRRDTTPHAEPPQQESTAPAAEEFEQDPYGEPPTPRAGFVLRRAGKEQPVPPRQEAFAEEAYAPQEEALPEPEPPFAEPEEAFAKAPLFDPEPMPEPEPELPQDGESGTMEFDTGDFARGPQLPPTAAGARWQAYRMLDGGDEDDAPEPEKPNDLNGPQDTARVRARLRRRVVLGAVRLGALTLTGGLSIYLVLTTIVSSLPLPAAISHTQSPGMFALALFILNLVSIAVCLPRLAVGFVSLLRLKADGDSLAAAAAFSTLLYTLALAVKPALLQNQNAQLYCVVAVAGLWFICAGRQMAAVRAEKNLSVLCSGEQLYAVTLLKGEGFADEMGPLLSNGQAQIAAAQPAGFLKGFLRHSDASVQEKGISRILAPICLGAAAVLAASSYFLYRDVLTCFTVFTAVLCVCAPFTALFGENIPLLRTANRLTAEGAMLAGGEAAERLADADAVVVEAAQLFGAGGITLHGIRTFKGGRIDLSILAAASIMEKVGGTMSDVFFQIIEGRTEILENVEDIVYEEGMGLSAWVDGKHVLIGNRELMRHHGIELPPREYEQKYRQDSRQVLYLSAGGELSSMFVVSYNATDEVYARLQRLERTGVTLIVRSTDPNITREMLTELFEVDYELIQIMPPHLHGVYAQQIAHTETAPAAAATMGGSLSLLDALLAAAKIRSAGAVSSVAQTLFVILGYVLTTVLTFFFGISLLNPLLLLCYQLVAALLTLAFLSLRRY